MFAKSTPNKRRLLAFTGAAAIGFIVFGSVLTTRSNAFTQVERQFAFDPIELNNDQTAHVAFNNTFGAQAIHITVRWTDGITGLSIGTPFQADVLPGHGVVALLPAVQTPPLNNGECCAQQPVVAIVSLSPTVGATAVPITLTQQFTASLDVVDNATQHVSLSHGWTNSILPAVQ